ncbi:S8 family serine peptidase [bacterium]|nr:S8 family serine peptidase [bacterium]MBU1990324.1 S8 family serine peptidase [bacterium]
MILINFSQNSIERGMKTSFELLISLIFVLIFTACEDKNTYSPNPETTIKEHFAILGPISEGNVSIRVFGTDEIIYTTKTTALTDSTSELKWNQYDVGSFVVDFNASMDLDTWLYTEISSGEDVDSDDDGIVTMPATPLKGVMKAYCRLEDFKSSKLIVNMFTTIGAQFYRDRNKQFLALEEYLSSFAKTVFVKSVDTNDGIDYKDLYSYIPNETQENYLISPNLYKNLLKYGVMDALLNDDNISALLLSDDDNDSLSLWDELLYDSSPILWDTDSDGIDDFTEIESGLNPALKDSDYDGIDDNDERVLYKTNPLNPDSDEDYIPDGIEIIHLSDPLDADENNNETADGLDGDPFLIYQWHIKSLGELINNTAGVSTVLGNDLNILDVYHRVLGNANGEKTIVQVIDTGVELLHEDIEVDLNNSYNAVTGSNDPTATAGVSQSDPTSPLNSGHGNAVAGILAAKTNNGLGVRGIIPRGVIAGSNWLEDQTLGELERVWYSQINDPRIVVSNNSWGAYYLKDTNYERLLAIATAQLRNEKGKIFTFAAGNSREEYGNANLSYLGNNPYVISVASLNHEDRYASYSNPGSNILVCGYGGEHYYTAPTIMTTLLMGESYYESELNGEKGVVTVDEDLEKNYTYAMNGTSSATPMVSGSIALAIDACPDLTWRDVKWLIANTSTVVDAANKSWIKNGAGLMHSIDYGYGKVNPLKMIDACRSKYFKTMPPVQYLQASVSDINTVIPDTNTTVIQTVKVQENLSIEWIGLTIDTDHPFAGDLEISLTSPMGTKTSIITPNEVNFAGYNGGFRFGSVAFVDEDSLGMWKIEITDRLEHDQGMLKNIKIEIHGYTR